MTDTAVSTPVTGSSKESPDPGKVTVVETKPVKQDTVQVPGVRLDLLEDTALIHMLNGQTKEVNYDELVNLLISFYDKKKKSLSADSSTSILLPDNLYRMSQGEKTLQLCFYYPERVGDVNYNGKIRASTIPNVIVTANFKRSKADEPFQMSSVRYFCTSLKRTEFSGEAIWSPDRNRKITVLPFTNVYDAGELCFGSNFSSIKLPTNDYRPAAWLYNVLWESPFNNDLGLKALHADSPYKYELAGWYKHLAERAEKGEGFPYKELGI